MYYKLETGSIWYQQPWNGEIKYFGEYSKELKQTFDELGIKIEND